MSNASHQNNQQFHDFCNKAEVVEKFLTIRLSSSVAFDTGKITHVIRPICEIISTEWFMKYKLMS